MGRKKRKKKEPTLAETLANAASVAVEFIVDHKREIALISGGAALALFAPTAWSALFGERRKGVVDQILENIYVEKQSLQVLKWVDGRVGGVDPRDFLKKARILLAWMHKNLSWKPDSTTDRAYKFSEVLERGGGDCDCLASFFCTAMEAAGHYTWIFIFLGDPGQQGHAVPSIEVTEAFVVKNFVPYVIAHEEPGNPRRYFMPCDPQLGEPGVLGEKWKKKVEQKQYGLFRPRRD